MKHPGLTFDDLKHHIYFCEVKDTPKTLDMPVYNVNKLSGQITVIEPGDATYVEKPKPGYLCLIKPKFTGKYFNIPVFYVHENNKDHSWMPGFIAFNHILFLNKADAKKLSMSILRKKKKELEAKMNRVKNL
jgi:hypothetical protein